MKTTDAQPVINGLHVMEIAVDASPMPAVKMTANYALARMKGEGQPVETHGKCTAYPNNWSKQTMERLRDLIESMEEDLLERHFATEPKEETDERTGHLEAEGPAQV